MIRTDGLSGAVSSDSTLATIAVPLNPGDGGGGSRPPVAARTAQQR